MSPDDQARLPPLAPYDEVAEKQRLADMKTFRQYLVETGTVKSLVELFKHTAKKEMRLDNSKILVEFLSAHVEDFAKHREQERLTEENSSLRDRSTELKSQADSLAAEVDKQRRLDVGTSLWKHLGSSDFWEGQLDEDSRAAGLPLTFLYQRLCGQKVDKACHNKVLVNLVRPASHDAKELVDAPSMPLEKFSTWIANGLPDSTGIPREGLLDWCRDELLPRFSSVPVPNEAPYERELLQEIQNTGLLPGHSEAVANIVSLDPNLVAFLDAAASTFRWG